MKDILVWGGRYLALLGFKVSVSHQNLLVINVYLLMLIFNEIFMYFISEIVLSFRLVLPNNDNNL